MVGGGIAGLAAAHRLIELKKEKSLDIEVVLLEASTRLGGTIATERVGDFLVEAGPDSFITEKPWALRCASAWALTSRLVSTQAAYQKIYVVHRRQAWNLSGRVFPTCAHALLALRSDAAFFLDAASCEWPPNFFCRAAATIGDESLGAFVRRRFGAEALDRVAQPLVGGIYASDPDKLSLTATMPRFKEMERANRSIILAMLSEQGGALATARAGSGARWSLFVTLAGGMQELVDRIVKPTSEGCVRSNAPVTNLIRDNGKRNSGRYTTRR